MDYSPDRSTYGPFNILQIVGPEGKKIMTFPYADVRGSQILVAVSDNTSKTKTQSSVPDFGQMFAIAEVGVWGIVTGYETLLKRQDVRQVTGPLSYHIAWDLPWQSIEIRVRNMSGGRRGTPTSGEAEIMQPASNPPAGQPPSPIYMVNGYQINVTMYLQKVREPGAINRVAAGTG